MRKRDDRKLDINIFQMPSVVESQKHAQWTGFTSNQGSPAEKV